MLELNKANTPVTSDLFLFACQMVRTETESLNIDNDAQQEKKTQHTSSTSDKKFGKESSDLPQALLP